MLPYVRIRLAGVGTYVKVEMHSGDDVHDLTKRACLENGPLWGVTGGQVTLHLLAPGGDEEPTEEETRRVLSRGDHLGTGWSLTRAGISPGSWLVARIIGEKGGGSSGGTAALGAALLGGGFRTLEQLLGLSLPISKENMRIISIMRTRFSNRALLCSLEGNALAAQALYEDAKIVPNTNTSVELGAAHGIVLDGPLISSVDPTKLTKCWRGMEPLVLKSLSFDEHTHLKAWQEAVASDPIPPTIAPCQMLHHGSKEFALMPWYLHTLSVMPSLPTDELPTLFHCMEGALNFVHGKGFAHCDVKSANICVDHRGEVPFVLVDLGSIAPLGGPAFSTLAYIPSDMEGISANSASAQLDWWMLAVTLAEKLRGGVQIGRSERAPPRPSIVACLQRGIPAVWAKLEPYLA